MQKRGYTALRMALASSRVLLLLPLTCCLVAFANEPDQKMLVGTCVLCHGLEGASMGPASPNLGGMDKQYFIASMLAFKHEGDEDALARNIKELAKLGSKEEYLGIQVYPRPSTLMKRLANGYTQEEILEMADYFSKTPIAFPREAFNPEMAEAGREIHLQNCAECHGYQGTFNRDGVPVLGGQWKEYLRYAFRDYLVGSRKMPKAMQRKMIQVQTRHGDEGFLWLTHFYASVRPEVK